MRGYGTIEELAERFGFIIVAQDRWNTQPMYNRECTVMLENGVYTFMQYD